MEIWDGFLQDGTLANVDLTRGEPIPTGIYHMVCDVLVRHSDGDYLLTQRDPIKPNYGGFFEATAGGAALKGEDNFTCAKRELFEETGIKADNFELLGRYISEHTIFFAYLCITDCDKTEIVLQKGETTAYKWLSETDFIDFINSGNMIESQKERYCDYFKKMGYLRG